MIFILSGHVAEADAHIRDHGLTASTAKWVATNQGGAEMTGAAARSSIECVGSWRRRTDLAAIHTTAVAAAVIVPQELQEVIFDAEA